MKETIRILVIEDEPVAQRALIQMLEKREYDVDLVKNAKTALEMSKYSYHLIFMDYELPKVEEYDLDGIEVAKLIRKWEIANKIKPRPIIMVSGFQKEEETEAKVKEAEINEYYTKPLNPDTLDNILEKYVAARLATCELVKC